MVGCPSAVPLQLCKGAAVAQKCRTRYPIALRVCRGLSLRQPRQRAWTLLPGAHAYPASCSPRTRRPAEPHVLWHAAASAVRSAAVPVPVRGRHGAARRIPQGLLHERQRPPAPRLGTGAGAGLHCGDGAPDTRCALLRTRPGRLRSRLRDASGPAQAARALRPVRGGKPCTA